MDICCFSMPILQYYSMKTCYLFSHYSTLSIFQHDIFCIFTTLYILIFLVCLHLFFHSCNLTHFYILVFLYNGMGINFLASATNVGKHWRNSLSLSHSLTCMLIFTMQNHDYWKILLHHLISHNVWCSSHSHIKILTDQGTFLTVTTAMKCITTSICNCSINE